MTRGRLLTIALIALIAPACHHEAPEETETQTPVAVAVDVAKGNKPAATATLDNGVKPVPSIFEKVISVDKENLMTTVVADGFHKASDLR